MPLKFRLKGLAETFIEDVRCPCCGQSDEAEEDAESFLTDLTRVTFDGIIVVMQCIMCSNVFVPAGQKLGVINSQRLRSAVEKDSQNTGLPLYPSLESVKLEVERLNASRRTDVH